MLRTLVNKIPSQMGETQESGTFGEMHIRVPAVYFCWWHSVS